MKGGFLLVVGTFAFTSIDIDIDIWSYLTAVHGEIGRYQVCYHGIIAVTHWFRFRIACRINCD